MVGIESDAAVLSTKSVDFIAERRDGCAACLRAVEETCSNADSLDFSEVVGLRNESKISAVPSAVASRQSVALISKVGHYSCLLSSEVAHWTKGGEDGPCQAVVFAAAGGLESLDGLLDVGVAGG